MQQSHWLLPAMYLRSSSEKAVLPKKSLQSPFMAQGQLQYDKSFKRQGDMHTTKLFTASRVHVPGNHRLSHYSSITFSTLTDSLPEQAAATEKEQHGRASNQIRLHMERRCLNIPAQTSSVHKRGPLSITCWALPSVTDPC